MVILAVVGAIAGVVGAIAATLVFFVPAATDDDASADSGDRKATTSPAVTTPATTTPATPSGAGGTSSRYLAELPAAAGEGLVEKKGRDLVVECPTNLTGDTFREISYELPAAYTTVAAQVTVGGEGDAEATAAVQVFTAYRQNISDRRKEAGRVVLQQGGAGELTAPLADATALTLRITCRSHTQVVTLGDARISR